MLSVRHQGLSCPLYACFINIHTRAPIVALIRTQRVNERRIKGILMCVTTLISLLWCWVMRIASVVELDYDWAGGRGTPGGIHPGGTGV